MELTPQDASTFSVVAGKLFNSKQEPVQNALIQLMVLDPKFPINIGRNWTLIGTEKLAPSGCLQFLTTTTSSDGSFKFDRVRKDGFIVLAFSGTGIVNKFFPIPEQYEVADLTAIKLEAELSGKLRVQIDKDPYLALDSITADPTNPEILKLIGRTKKNIPPNDTEVVIENLPPGSYTIQSQRKPTVQLTGKPWAGPAYFSVQSEEGVDYTNPWQRVVDISEEKETLASFE